MTGGTVYTHLICKARFDTDHASKGWRAFRTCTFLVPVGHMSANLT